MWVLGSFGVSGFWLLRRHLSYAHRLKIVDNRKKNRTNCSNKQQTETTTTSTTRGSLQLLFGLCCVVLCFLWPQGDAAGEAERSIGCWLFWRRVQTKFERVIQHAIIKLLKDKKHNRNNNKQNRLIEGTQR